jgi:hypothetical protein
MVTRNELWLFGLLLFPLSIVTILSAGLYGWRYGLFGGGRRTRPPRDEAPLAWTMTGMQAGWFFRGPVILKAYPSGLGIQPLLMPGCFLAKNLITRVGRSQYSSHFVAIEHRSPEIARPLHIEPRAFATLAPHLGLTLEESD